MNNKKLNCKTCGYKYCPFHGSDREIPAYFCEDYKPTEEGESMMEDHKECPVGDVRNGLNGSMALNNQINTIRGKYMSKSI